MIEDCGLRIAPSNLPNQKTMIIDIEHSPPEQRRTLEEIARRYHLSLMLLFGSHATDRTTAESDVDIAVQTERPEMIADLDYHLNLTAELSACLEQGEIDLVFLNEADPLLKAEVGRDAKVLFEEDDAFANFAVRTMKEFDDARYFHFKILREVLENFYETATQNHPRGACSEKVRKVERVSSGA